MSFVSRVCVCVVAPAAPPVVIKNTWMWLLQDINLSMHKNFVNIIITVHVDTQHPNSLHANNVSFFPSSLRPFPAPLSYLPLPGPHSFRNYIAAIILGRHFCTVNHAHFVIKHRSVCVCVCEWEEGTYEVERGSEDTWTMHACQHVSCEHPLYYVCSCVLALAARICMHYRLYPSWKCVINLSVHVTMRVCLSPPHVVRVAQYMTRVMMCKGMMCNELPHPGRSQPLALDAPLYTHVLVRVSVFLANLTGVCSPFYSLQAVCCLFFCFNDL